MTARADHPHDAALPTGLLAGDRRAVARAISRIEQGAPEAAALKAALAPHLGRAQVIGLTGAPGAGKSTLVHAMLGELLARGRRIGVVAVDPSSPITGGAVLGDRVRMGRHGAHDDVFIRSVASRGHLGGLSKSTAEIVDVLDAAGFDTILIETVGAGQSEVEIMRVADTRIVVSPPGLGDDVQAIKAGILEIADILVVTKGDLPGAEATARDLKNMLALRSGALARRIGDHDAQHRPIAADLAASAGSVAEGHGNEDGWAVPVLRTCATGADTGVATLIDQAQAHGRIVGSGRRLAGRRPAETHPARDKSAMSDVTHGRPPLPTDPGELVRCLAQADPFVRSLGITCVEAGAGFATMSVVLDSRHINFNNTCHGGVIFTLADTAFGLAANSYGKIAAGIDTHMTFQQAAQAGDTLTARAMEVSRSNKLAVYRVDVDRGHGRLVSSFTGTVYVTTRGHSLKG